MAALAGMGSFVAPCILPMIPAFLAYMSGTAIREAGGPAVTVSSTRVVLNSAFFVAGFSVVFSLLGAVINGVLAGSSAALVGGLNQVGGVIIVGFGAFLVASPRVARLNAELRFLPRRGQAGYPASFLFGLAFAAGWTPCVGPVLGAILTLAATTPGDAFNLLLAYSAGMGVPFVLMAAFFSRATRVVRAMSRGARYYSPVLGAFIVALGVLVFFNQLAYVASFPLLGDLLLLG